MNDVKKTSWRLPVNLGKYSGVRDEAATPEPDPVKKHSEPPESGTPNEATSIPYRGQGASVEHGVRPSENVAEPWDDQWRQAERAASRTVPVPEPVEVETPFPVKVVSNAPPTREERTFITDAVAVNNGVMNLLGSDPMRVRVMLRNLSASGAVIYVGNDENALRTGAGYPLVNSDVSGEVVLHTTEPIWVTADAASTVHYLVERIRPL